MQKKHEKKHTHTNNQIKQPTHIWADIVIDLEWVIRRALHTNHRFYCIRQVKHYTAQFLDPPDFYIIILKRRHPS